MLICHRLWMSRCATLLLLAMTRELHSTSFLCRELTHCLLVTRCCIALSPTVLSLFTRLKHQNTYRTLIRTASGLQGVLSPARFLPAL